MPGSHLISLQTQMLPSQMEVFHNKQTKMNTMQTKSNLNVSEYAYIGFHLSLYLLKIQFTGCRMAKHDGSSSVAVGKEGSFCPTLALLCFQLTCQSSHSQKGTISGFGSVMNESGPSPIVGASILRMKITEPSVDL